VNERLRVTHLSSLCEDEIEEHSDGVVDVELSSGIAEPSQANRDVGGQIFLYSMRANVEGHSRGEYGMMVSPQVHVMNVIEGKSGNRIDKLRVQHHSGVQEKRDQCGKRIGRDERRVDLRGTGNGERVVISRQGTGTERKVDSRRLGFLPSLLFGILGNIEDGRPSFAHGFSPQLNWADLRTVLVSAIECALIKLVTDSVLATSKSLPRVETVRS